MTKRYTLTERSIAKEVREAKAAGKTQVTDGQGLYLKLGGIEPSWRFDYKSPVTGKRNTAILGPYPAVSLDLARDKAQAARELIARGGDPAMQRDEDKAKQQAAVMAIEADDARTALLRRMLDKPNQKATIAPAGTLLGVAQDMYADRLTGGAWKAQHATQWLGMITRCVPSRVALMPIADVKPTDILRDVIRPQEAAGRDATAITVRRFLSDLFDYAERMELRQGNPARVIRKDAKKAEHSENIGNNPGVTDPTKLAVILRAISDWANPVTRAALQVQAALFQRPGDTCSMRWADVDLDAARWVITPAKRTKLHKTLKGGAHIIKLPTQVVAVLSALKPLTGHSEWVFLSTANTGKPITNDTLTNALRNMGFGDIQTAHGFRATARTMIPDQCGTQPQYVEAQLPHSIGMQTIDGRMVRDPNGTAYQRATWVNERGVMLQAWADYLDSLLAVEVPTLPATEVQEASAPLLLAA